MHISLLQTIVLAIVQGITEFLPVSSSAHLILVPKLSDWPDQGLGFDLSVHLGTLTAVVLYFRHELAAMAGAGLRSLLTRHLDGEARLAWAVVLGTIPVGLTGLLFGAWIESALRSARVITVTTVGYGLLLWWADHRAGSGRREQQLGWRDVAIVGCAQALALVPGTSRSGITMTAGLFCGLSRTGAARFSFLLAIPVTALAGVLKLLELAAAGAPVDWFAFALGGIISALCALLCIHYFLQFLSRFGMLPYVVYRLLLGAALLTLFGW